MKRKKARMTALVSAVMVAACCGMSWAQNNPNDIAPGTRKAREAVTINPETVKTLNLLNERFAETAKLWQAKDLEGARRKPNADVEIGHRSLTVTHLACIGYRLNRRLRWDPAKEDFINDAEASRYLDTALRAPWRI